jgi:hypothetical protein
MNKIMEMFTNDPVMFVFVTVLLIGFAISTIKGAWKE